MPNANLSDKMPNKHANRGFLNARQLKDILAVARIARETGTTLIVHDVTVGQNVFKEHTGSTYGRDPSPKEPIGKESEKPTHKQQKSAARLEEYNESKRAAACGARWLPFVKTLLRRSRAKLRGDIWTERMRTMLALRDKANVLLFKAWTRHAEQRALIARSDDESDWMAPWSPAAQPSSVRKIHVQPSPPPPQEVSIFGPESFRDDNGDDDDYDADEIQAAIAASLADARSQSPVDQGANRAEGYHTPPSGRAPAPNKKTGKKTRGGRSTKPLQTANRG